MQHWSSIGLNVRAVDSQLEKYSKNQFISYFAHIFFRLLSGCKVTFLPIRLTVRIFKYWSQCHLGKKIFLGSQFEKYSKNQFISYFAHTFFRIFFTDQVHR